MSVYVEPTDTQKRRMNKYQRAIAAELGLSEVAIAGALSLLEEGATIPFIARYRKERTGEMDEESLRAVRDRSEALAALDGRRKAVLKSLGERGILTDGLERRVLDASTLAAIEDIYLPYRPKRKTRASVARECGLSPLADELLSTRLPRPVEAAAEFVDPSRGVTTAEEALAGARDIIAEKISENAEVRAALRKLFEKGTISSALRSKKKAEDARIYGDYFDWSEPIQKTQAHRVHAVLRGERDGFLTVHVAPAEVSALRILIRLYVRYDGVQYHQLLEACTDAYHRLIKPSLETEQKTLLKSWADRTALDVFAANLRELLLAPPFGERPVMGIDPGFRTGCKLVCLGPLGDLLFTTTIYPLEPKKDTSEAAKIVLGLIEQYTIEAIAVGNGTGGREAEAFVRATVDGLSVSVVSVNEAGASVYSASAAAREEFPDHDITVRGAVSIARRLMDPLAELVKIDPKSIGVGQYQHDVDQKSLASRLSDTIVSCVNSVGVELNTASAWLLSYVSGLSKRSAQAIVEHRRTHGAFTSRMELSAVKGIGEKALSQSAGFLRIRNGKDPLDSSGVHPERYDLIKRMAKALGVTTSALVGDSDLASRLDLDSFADDGVGLPTLIDIRAELQKPGRDPRTEFELFSFSDDVKEIGDLKIGAKLPGIVTNVTNFGAFVDIGVHRDGLIHISKLADRYVTDPKQVVKVNQRLEVTVVEIDHERNRIGLSLIE